MPNCGILISVEEANHTPAGQHEATWKGCKEKYTDDHATQIVCTRDKARVYLGKARYLEDTWETRS